MMKRFLFITFSFDIVIKIMVQLCAIRYILYVYWKWITKKGGNVKVWNGMLCILCIWFTWCNCFVIYDQSSAWTGLLSCWRGEGGYSVAVSYRVFGGNLPVCHTREDFYKYCGQLQRQKKSKWPVPYIPIDNWIKSTEYTPSFLMS